MNDVKLKLAFWNYDRTRPLADGTVKIDGVDASFESAKIVTEIFERMIRDRAFDVAELGLTYFLRMFEMDDPPFLAIPVFPNRCFRHSAIYINTESGIEKPEDLAGKTSGELAVYGHDAGVWPKGILSDEYGVRPERSRWVIGGLDWPLGSINFIPHPHPANVEVNYADQNTDLGEMLAAGRIDALISTDVPKCMLEGSPKIRRLFPDYEAAERDYYRRTGIFPIMHTVVIRKELAAEHPGLAKAIYYGFCDAKTTTMEHYQTSQIFMNMDVMFPWFGRLIDEDRQLMGDDWWPYGMAANRTAMDTFLRYFFEQGLSKRQLTCEDIFVPELLDT